MNKSTKTRYAIFQILSEISKKNINFEKAFNKIISEFQFNQNEISFINNVCLNTMRKNIHCKIILEKIVKKKIKTNELILLSTAIVQILYLNIKHYAVVNESVNVAKKIRVFPGFINAVLKNVIKNSNNFKKIKININQFPKWFINQIKISKNINLDLFINTFHEQPNLHLVFKSEKYLINFKEPHYKSSKKSAFIDIQKKVNNIENFNKGEWWVQDFSSMIPLAINTSMKKLEILDMCAAPGGKAFQLIKENNVTLNDISKKRILKLKDNLFRLSFNQKVTNIDGLNFDEEKKFDVVLLDSPCSSIGTIRRHPEILFRSKGPDFKMLNDLQKKLLLKASKLLKHKGRIVYMVCSFFHSETLSIVNNFLRENKNFSIEKYYLNEEFSNIKSLISDDGYFLTMPTKYKKYNIDGFFSAQLIKND